MTLKKLVATGIMYRKLVTYITALSWVVTAYASEEPTAFEYIKRQHAAQVDAITQYCHENAPEADPLVSTARTSFMSSLEQALEIWLAEKPGMKQTLLQTSPANLKERKELEQKMQELGAISKKSVDAIRQHDPHTYCPWVANKFNAATSATVLKSLHEYDRRVTAKLHQIDESTNELSERSPEANNKYAEISRLRDSKLTAEVLENGYAPTLIKLIKSNIKYKPEAGLAGNPTATFHVRLFPNGEVLSVTKLVGSGVLDYDTAIEKAIYYSSPFPKRSDGKVERELELIFRLKN